ncbi:MAG: flippase-like domain-containing protein [Fibromonadales bacterium]|nr:flippase-like domain-containing protein [Fibromonadales bacterium]
MKSIPWQIKLAISILLLALVVWKFPVYEIVQHIKNAKIGWLILAFVFGELIILNQAFRWHYLLIVPKEQKPKFGSLLKYTAVGYLFNLFAPGGVGGDVYRSIALGKAHNVIASSVASVLVARILGLVALCLLFWIALPYSEHIPQQAIWFMAVGTSFLIIFCFCVIFNPFKKGKLGEFAEKLREYKKYPLRLVAAMFGSLFMQILGVLMQWSVFKAVDISVQWSLVFVVVPVTIMLTTIPISFNGIGVREWSLLSLTAYAVNSEQLLASVLLGYAVVILQAVQGSIFLHLPHDRIRV